MGKKIRKKQQHLNMMVKSWALVVICFVVDASSVKMLQQVFQFTTISAHKLMISSSLSPPCPYVHPQTASSLYFLHHHPSFEPFLSLSFGLSSVF